MIGPYRISNPSADTPEVSLPQRRGESKCGEGRYVVVHFLVQVSQIETCGQVFWEANVDVRPVGQHGLHRPLPKVVPALVLWTLKGDFGRVE